MGPYLALFLLLEIKTMLARFYVDFSINVFAKVVNLG
jgi:hypothetical protein